MEPSATRVARRWLGRAATSGIEEMEGYIYDYGSVPDRDGYPEIQMVYWGYEEPDGSYEYQVEMKEGRSERAVDQRGGFGSETEVMQAAFESALARAKRAGFVLVPEEAKWPPRYLVGREGEAAATKRKQKYDATGRL